MPAHVDDLDVPPRERPSDAPPWPLRRGLRWFVAEFAVVVSGVLVALALNAFYQHRHDVGREQAYLQQIAADLQESTRLFEAEIEKNVQNTKRLDSLAVVLATGRAPSDSALIRLVYVDLGHASPITGAARALIQTGDLNLIRDDSVRSAVIRFVGQSDDYIDRSRDYEVEWLIPSVRALFAQTRALLAPGYPAPLTADALFADPDFYDAVHDLRLAFRNYVVLQRRMLDELDRSRALVDTALRE